MPTRSKRKTRAPAGRPRGLPVPRGFGTVTPYLSVVGGPEAMEFYKSAFGAQELQREVTPSGKLVHGRLKIGSSIVLLSDVFEGSPRAAPSTVGTTTVTLHVYSTDVEKLWNRAVAAGAKITMPLADQFWGERYGELVDPFGHRWSLSMRIRMSAAEKAAKRQEAMRAFAHNEHPDRTPVDSDI
jgi:PhnB protein